MLGQHGKPFKVYGNARPTELEIRRVVPYRDKYNSHFCDSCVREFGKDEEAVEIGTWVERWEEEPCSSTFLVCDKCYAQGATDLGKEGL